MKTLNNFFRTREDTVFLAIFILFSISLLIPYIFGIYVARYAIYAAPFIAFLIWLSSGKVEVSLNRQIAPFLFLVFLIAITAYDANYNWLKKAYFVFAYTIVFFMFDMTKARVNIKAFNLLFIAAFIISALKSNVGYIGFSSIESALLDSAAGIESTFAFPLGLFAIYFLSKKQYFWSLANILLAILAFKRVVILALAVSLIAFIIPNKVKKLFVNPYVISLVTIFGIFLIITIASGDYDSLIMKYLGVSSNQLLMGRQALWSLALRATEYNFIDYLIYGTGHGEVTLILQEHWDGHDVLLHSDLLLILLEHGFIAFTIFVFLLNRQLSNTERYLTIYLTILLFTDNVLIYHHVMIPYLLMMAMLRKDYENDDAKKDLIKKEANGNNSLTKPDISQDSLPILSKKKTSQILTKK